MSQPQSSAQDQPVAVRRVQERALAGTAVAARVLRTPDGADVGLLEAGDGPPVVLLPGTLSSGLFWLPLLPKLRGLHAIAPDRPGQGLSDPAAVSEAPTREAAVAWVDRLLDALELPTVTLVGHSMGGLWGLWFALARPERVDRLAMIGTPALPGTRAPLPFRLLATPGLGALIGRQKPTPASVRRFAAMVGEGATMGRHRDLIDSMVAGGREPGAAVIGRREVRTIVSPLALLTRSGFRRDTRLLPQELGRLRTPTLLVWGDHDPVGSPVIAQRLAEMLPDGYLRMVPGGHVPWLGSPDAVASALTGFVSPAGWQRA